MNDRVDVDDILDRFREWLDSARAEAGERRHLRADGLARVRRRSRIRDHRSGRGVHGAPARAEAADQERPGAFDQTETTVAALKQAIEQFRSVEPKEAQAAWTAGKALAEALADLDEALDRGQREIERARQQIAELSPATLEARSERAPSPPVVDPPPAAAHLPPPGHRDRPARQPATPRALFDSFLEGYGLIQKRLAAGDGIRAGRARSPARAAGRSRADDRARGRRRAGSPARNGHQRAEARLYLRGRVIRYAEVQAVRSGLTLPERASRRRPARRSDRQSSSNRHLFSERFG